MPPSVKWDSYVQRNSRVYSNLNVYNFHRRITSVDSSTVLYMLQRLSFSHCQTNLSGQQRHSRSLSSRQFYPINSLTQWSSTHPKLPSFYFVIVSRLLPYMQGFILDDQGVWSSRGSVLKVPVNFLQTCHLNHFGEGRSRMQNPRNPY